VSGRETSREGEAAPDQGWGLGAGAGGNEPPQLVKRLQRRREAYRQHGIAYRVAWVTAAVIVILAGIAMIIFPGPALVVIPIGLAMLSLEFAWAQRLLDTTLEKGVDAKEIAKNASRRQQIVGVAAIVCAIAAVAALALIILL
jgi:uncharacterized protein (TIGR02611 family)